MSATGPQGNRPGSGLLDGASGWYIFITMALAAFLLLVFGPPLALSGARDQGFVSAFAELWGFVLGGIWSTGSAVVSLAWSLGPTAGAVILGTLTVVIILAVLWVLTELGSAEQQLDPEAESGPWTFTNLLRTVTIMLITVPVIMYRDVFLSNPWWVLGAVLLALFGYVIFVFLQQRQRRARTETAVRRTQSQVSSSIEDWTAIAVGGVLTVVAIVLGLLTGAISALGTLDQFITPLLNEIGFVVLTMVGYVQLGGDFMGSAYIPDLNAGQWVGMALVIIALVLVFRE